MYLTSSGAGVLGTFLPNLSAALSWGIVAGSVSEPGRNQEESGEKLRRKLTRSQVFSEAFRREVFGGSCSVGRSVGHLMGASTKARPRPTGVNKTIITGSTGIVHLPVISAGYSVRIRVAHVL